MQLLPRRVVNPTTHLVSTGVRTLLRCAQSLLFTWNCPVCSRLLPYPSVICDECAATLRRIESPFCIKCGTPFPSDWIVKKCADCQTRKSPLTAIRSAYRYEGVVREMVRGVKYARLARYTRFFGEQLYLLAAREFGTKIRAVVPVPLHRRREWLRNFNQAQLMAEHLRALYGLPLWRGLKKIQETGPQSLLSGAARRSNVKGSFACADGLSAPRTVLLVDDVITTGATLEECARVLRRKGARRVYAVTVARALPL